jgi:hypothetical protein
MFELLGRPTNTGDALAIIKSTELLQETCSNMRSRDGIEVCWDAAATWLRDVSHHLHKMVDDLYPVALLVMAYWSRILVNRAESKACWFLKGAVKVSILRVAEKLMTGKIPLFPLILDFEDSRAKIES